MTQAAVLTVGDELLAGRVENTNASWLARRLTERGVEVAEIQVVPDRIARIRDAVARHADAYDATLVTGGVGGTPDDVTVDGVAAAFDREVVVHPEARASVARAVEGMDSEVDVDAWAQVPEGAAVLHNDEGLSPGCALRGVYVLPGIPSEMKAMFESVVDEFRGDRHTAAFAATGSESNLVPHLRRARERFDAAVGCYPTPGEDHKRVTVTSGDEALAREARDWLAERVAAETEADVTLGVESE
jgi:molybdenum cofactor synthesis domain-containing protein